MSKRMISLVCAFSLSCTGAFAGEASGTFSSGNSVFSPKIASAIEIRDTSDPSRRTVAIVLTEEAVNIDAAATDLDPYRALINIPELMQRSHVTVFVHEDGTVAYNAQVAGDSTQYVDSTKLGLKADVDRADPASLKARVHSPPGSDATPIDVQFTTRVTRMPAGTPIARGGGDAGNSLVELVRAIKAGDSTTIRQLVDADTLAGMTADYRSDEENVTAILDVLRMWLPEKVEILGGRLVGADAFLDVRGPMFDMPHHFAVKLKRVADHWVLTEAAPLGPAP